MCYLVNLNESPLDETLIKYICTPTRPFQAFFAAKCSAYAVSRIIQLSQMRTRTNFTQDLRNIYVSFL